VRDASDLPVLLAGLPLDRHRRAADDTKSLRAVDGQRRARDRRMELELPGYAFARVDS
jgi:hypothetical protein